MAENMQADAPPSVECIIDMAFEWGITVIGSPPPKEDDDDDEDRENAAAVYAANNYSTYTTSSGCQGSVITENVTYTRQNITDLPAARQGESSPCLVLFQRAGSPRRHILLS